MSDNPLVTVAIITYNQEDYISKALDSVMDQITDFDFEVIIGDDASTDQTSALCQKYSLMYPGRIVHCRHQRNLGYIDNLLATLAKSSAKYVALLEADDHWASKTKLADQIEMLEKHPEVSLCFTNASIDDTLVPEKKRYFDRTVDMVFTYLDCLNQIVAPTSTFVFRREWFEPPDWFRELKTYEYFLIYLLASKGPIYYLNKVTACRTQHYRGQSIKSLDAGEASLANARFLNRVLSEYPPKMRLAARSLVVRSQLNTVPFLLSQGSVTLAWKTILQVRIWEGVRTPGRGKTGLRYLKELIRLIGSSVGLRRIVLRNVKHTRVRGQARF